LRVPESGYTAHDLNYLIAMNFHIAASKVGEWGLSLTSYRPFDSFDHQVEG